MRFSIAIAALLALPVTAADSPSRHLVPDFDQVGLARACETGLATARKAIKAMEKRSGPGAIFDEWNRLAIGIEDLTGPAELLVNVHPGKTVRESGEDCLRKMATLNTELFQNEKVFKRVNAANPSNGHQAKLKKDLIERFEDSGVKLPPPSRKRATEIQDKLAELDQTFQRNVRDDATRVIFRPEEMAGLPEPYLKAHAYSRDKDGNYALAPKAPSYSPFLRNAKDEAARQRYYLARQNRGGKANLDILHDLFKLRHELAGLYGFPTFASYSLRRKMAGNPETVMKFLADIKEAFTSLENKEVKELREAKAKDTARPLGQTKLNHWDVDYYQEVIRRERFAIDQERLRKYFPTDKSVDFALLVAQTLYGVNFREVKVPAWHPDVRYFDVLDAKSGRFIAGIYLDLFPREGKHSGGVAFPIYGASRIEKRTPLCALVVNLSRDGLTQSQLAVLMHEFGHVLHGALSSVDYNPHSGLNVKNDFVEAPSRVFEEWARREQPLELFKQVCPGCPHLTRDEVARLNAAQRYGQGIGNAGEWLRAVFDMALSTKPEPPLDLWRKLEAATPLGHAEGTMFPASFGHIAGGMAAGYYGYLWSEALALEMLTHFRPNMLDPDVGERFRQSVLSQGGQKEEIDLVRAFLGREPSSEWFFDEMADKH